MAEGFSSSTSDGEFSSENSSDLSYGSLTNLPEFLIPRAKEIRSLLLQNNSLTKLPDSFGLFINLISVDLSNNSLASICNDILHLKSLRTLIVRNNGLKNSSIPKDFGMMPSLETVNFSGNELGELPHQFTELKKLKSLYLGGNKINIIPSSVKNLRKNNPLVVKFVQDLVHDPPSLMELAGRTIKIERVRYTKYDLPENLIQYLKSAQRCVNPKCKGVYFTSRVESVKFVDFCGKYRLPLMQYLCSPSCSVTPVVSCQSDTETDDEDSAKAMMRRVLLG
ncbi:hypothetical protein KUTeg_006266 [Tegillarca granosa]|uniref:Leucine-rich repeat-containing protein 58 n=1 Tax=Tegillarca granosa TaxID=220873 RepID=A0ABQ9FFZ5_TEGGR|nr:hypothetical protein KUTeg_006266 [Tegillarca granosa]